MKNRPKADTTPSARYNARNRGGFQTRPYDEDDPMREKHRGSGYFSVAFISSVAFSTAILSQASAWLPGPR